MQKLKICSLVSTEYMNVADGRTDTAHNGMGRTYDIIARQTSSVATGFGRYGMPPRVCNPDL